MTNKLVCLNLCNFCQVVEAVMKECKKENIAYKVEAMKCMGNLLEGYKVDQFQDMWNLITPVLKVKCHVKVKYLSKGESHFKVTYIFVVKRLL